MPYATLPERGLLALSGDDSLPFLQGLVSNDVLRLKSGGIAYAALLTPQGKFLHDFFLISRGPFILLDCLRSRLPDLQKRLMMYRLRSKVDIQPAAYGVSVVWDERDIIAPASKLTVFPDPRLPALGWRVYGAAEPVAAWCGGLHIAEASDEDYDLHRLRLGVPVGTSDLIPEKSFLLPFGFEDLHGVDFHKGCYVGQEVTARSKHLGQVRKCIYKVTGTGNTLPAPGTAVYDGEMSMGEMRSSQGNTGLALLGVAEVEKAAREGHNLRCGDTALQASLPEWIKSTNVTKT